MSAREQILPVFVPHLGCPHACVFCNQNRIAGADRPATAETVKSAIEQAAALPRNGAKRQLAFYGGSFTAIPIPEQTELLTAAREAIAAGEIDSVRISTRPDAIDSAGLIRLRDYGVETVELGAQSMHDQVLRLSGRGHTAADVERAARLVKESGCRLILQMMTGLPGDTPERSLETARRLIALEPDGVRIYPTVVVRDTMLHTMWLEGRYEAHTIEQAVTLCAKLLPLFQEAEIPVIRLGLNPTEELSGGAAVAGAYHPALGELVKSRMLYEKARALLAEKRASGSVCLAVAPACVSQMVGQHRENVERLCREFGLHALKVVAGPVKNGEIQWLSIEN